MAPTAVCRCSSCRCSKCSSNLDVRGTHCDLWCPYLSYLICITRMYLHDIYLISIRCLYDMLVCIDVNCMLTNVLYLERCKLHSFWLRDSSLTLFVGVRAVADCIHLLVGGKPGNPKIRPPSWESGNSWTDNPPSALILKCEKTWFPSTKFHCGIPWIDWNSKSRGFRYVSIIFNRMSDPTRALLSVPSKSLQWWTEDQCSTILPQPTMSSQVGY